jgi:hypothetical protein
MGLGMTVNQMLRAMPASELAEWEAYWRIEPWGEARADLRAGIVASTLANAHRKKGARPFAPSDFMPYAEKAAPSGRALAERLKAAFALLPRKGG